MGKTHSFRSKWPLAFCSFFCFLQACADEPSYMKTDDGVIVYTDPFFTGASRAVKLAVVNANIIRVIQAPGKEIFPVQSLITVYPKKQAGNWSLIPGKESLRLITKRLQAVVQLKTGAVSFFLILRVKGYLLEKQMITAALCHPCSKASRFITWNKLSRQRVMTPIMVLASTRTESLITGENRSVFSKTIPKWLFPFWCLFGITVCYGIIIRSRK